MADIINIPLVTIERLVQYNRLLVYLAEQGKTHVFSHVLAEMANNTAAQVRRDLMLIGSTGSSAKGYDTEELIEKISGYLQQNRKHKMALAGVGNLGRALLSFFSYRRPNLVISVAFDTDEAKVGRVISGCRCHHMRDSGQHIREHDIKLGIITVPAQYAQETADRLVEAGITGILNFAPVPLQVPEGVFVDELDITMKLEKLAFLSSR